MAVSDNAYADAFRDMEGTQMALGFGRPKNPAVWNVESLMHEVHKEMGSHFFSVSTTVQILASLLHLLLTIVVPIITPLEVPIATLLEKPS